MSEVIRAIVFMVAAHFDVRPDEIMARDRRVKIVWPRQVAAYIAREATGLSWSQLGRAFGRDHTTILHSHRVVARSKPGADLAPLFRHFGLPEPKPHHVVLPKLRLGVRSDWREKALCSPVTAFLFDEATNQRRVAKAICGACPVRSECLVDALAADLQGVIAGGLTTRERRLQRRKRRRATYV